MASLLNFLTPPPFIQPEHYLGTQYTWNFLVFRPALFKTQACLLLALLFYIALALYGKSANARKANAMYTALLPLLSHHFSAPTSSSGLISDGPTDLFVFSTGRRALASLHSVFSLRPRQDPLQILWQSLWGMYDLRYDPVDELTLDFLLDPETAANAPDFVWAVVQKRELSTIRDRRWDLTFTRTTEHPSLPPTLSLMSEFADVSEALLKLPLTPSTTLPTLLSSPKTLPYLRSLSITDQPPERPHTASSYVTEKLKNKRVVLNLTLPDAAKADEVLHIVDAAFVLVDILAAGKVVLRPETKTKIKKVREDVVNDIKQEEVKEKKEEAAEGRKAAKRRAEDDKFAKLSAAEQKKVLERNHKRAMRKSQGKVVRKS
ncbi:hypothetical protein PAXRUDRAFT_136887 [Paxillus rubicundulus Ve08.2h10]|uniref:DUF1682-domain-containing protein n=1 Tax=Paxillus rubicundulus Ve08.2h10 TaxID=930991 RepID=A0A0D0EB52_9AGAM|nr:hypothetical protein PAXRUDRAFT_136887 [Paxillus rubicundulus Ve08.2h10]